jgi:hypothetical protein
VLYRGIRMLAGSAVNTTTPRFEYGNFLVYVDANTGDVPRAETI